LIKNNDKYIKQVGDVLELSTLIENDNNFEFYFENNNSLFIENGCEYTVDGRFIKSTTDTLFNKTIYDIDEITGLTKSITNPKGQVTNYEYDNKRRLSKVINKDNELKPIFKGSKIMVYENILNHNIYVRFYDKFYSTQILQDRLSRSEKIRITKVENQKILEQVLKERDERLKARAKQSWVHFYPCFLDFII